METDILPLQGRAASLDEVFKMQDIILACGEPEAFPVINHFGPGVYMREVIIPAGMLLTGKIHRQADFNILLEGEITVQTDQGMQRLTAPYIFLGQPGMKKVAYTHSKTRWLNIHPTNFTSLEDIEKEQIIPDSDIRDSQGMIDLNRLKQLVGES